MPEGEDQRSPAVEASAPREAARVLVIDDEPMVLRLAQRGLKGFLVSCAEGGAAGLEALRDPAAFDAVVCDLMMPGVNGMQIHAALQQAAPALAARCLFVTGGAFTPEARAFVEWLGPARIVEKPFRLEALVAAVERVLAEGRREVAAG
jgi:CheY-like chemotaxis protein